MHIEALAVVGLFPFLFGRAFIEARQGCRGESVAKFLRFSTGTFIEATLLVAPLHPKEPFPFLFWKGFH